MQQVESRRYRVTAVLGEGGFGKVYRAQMMGPEGFTKDVAIKLLHAENVPEEALQRFRDEARILGLVRDRAVVSVEPPTQLGGRWAVVMEYVDGASAKALLRLGVFPVDVVAEILQEVARALGHVYSTPGPDGEPIQLLHRDIKPENIQVSRSGEVKILDFGIARARFGSREAHTTTHIGGTVGYIAPERLHGIEGPEADVFSMGVMAHFLLEGKRPAPDSEHSFDGGTLQGQMLAFAARMRSPKPEERPSTREVEDFCRQLARASDGISLRRWAEAQVPQARQLQEDGLVGHVLTETIAGVSLESSISSLERRGPGPRRRVWVLIAALAVLAVGMLAVAFGGLGIVAATWVQGPPPVAPIPPAAPIEVFENGSVHVPVRRVDGVKEEPEPRVVLVPTPSPVPPSPVETPVEPSPDPAPVAATFPITLTSVPAGAQVFVDGRALGNTPLFAVELSSGAHTIKMVSAGETATRSIRVGKHKPTRYVWKGGDSWRIYSN